MRTRGSSRAVMARLDEDDEIMSGQIMRPPSQRARRLECTRTVTHQTTTNESKQADDGSHVERLFHAVPNLSYNRHDPDLTFFDLLTRPKLRGALLRRSRGDRHIARKLGLLFLRRLHVARRRGRSTSVRSRHEYVCLWVSTLPAFSRVRAEKRPIAESQFFFDRSCNQTEGDFGWRN